MPHISVVMSVYNGKNYIEEAIRSVLQQTYDDFEFIILDNCSTDGTVEIIRQFDDKRIRLIQNETNLGISGSLNRGIELSKGDYIARIDADDLCYPDRFKLQVSYMDKHPEVCLCAGHYDIMLSGKIKKTSPDAGLTSRETQFAQYFVNQVCHSTVMIRRTTLLEHGLKYDTKYRFVQDYDLWMQLIRHGELVILPDKMICYRLHDNNFSNNRNPMLAERQDVLENNMRNLSVPKEAAELLSKAVRYKLDTAKEVRMVGEYMLDYYSRCGLSLEDAHSRQILETCYYTMILHAMYMGVGVYMNASSSGVFRWNSIYRVKTLIKSAIKWRFKQ